MLEISETDVIEFVLVAVFTGVNTELVAAFLVDSAFISVAESEKSTIFFLSQRFSSDVSA